MPLSFKSESHGDIAFGFFNIESDMLLLENYFFFADRFCEWMIQMASKDEAELTTLSYKVHFIDNSDDIGDLMGAIHGVRFTGFIGKTYTMFPFPSDPKGFKQNPEGFNTQKIINEEIDKFSRQTELTVDFPNGKKIKFGPYLFDIPVFHELIRYVWQGGYPCWKDEKRPQYVLDMRENIMKSHNSFFKGVFASKKI
ncbi:MAG: hypothetical protein KAR45_07160 [Desulfobacteraceae bacterium]|nr:hypothetical protein [Desulfobacteraceae bacterium]